VTWLSWHEISERAASEAHTALRRGERDRALALFRDAAAAERKALEELDPSKVRTAGITAVSAVSLYFKGRQLAEAQQLAMQWLAVHQAPPFAVEQMRNLVQSIWTAQAMRSAGVAFLPGQVIVSVKGGQAVVGGAPLELVVDKVQSVQSLFYRTVEFLKDLPLRKRGPPTQEIQEACRPWLFQAQPGSYAFSVAVQEPAQHDFFKKGTPPEQVAETFLSVLRASTEDPASALRALVPAEDYRATFLKLARNLAPTGRNFDAIEVRDANDVRGVVLDSESRRTMNEALRPKPAAGAEPEEIDELHGVLRALHLERDWLELIVDGQSRHVDGLSEAVDDIIGPMVNRKVVVRAKRARRGKSLRFVDIELEEG